MRKRVVLEKFVKLGPELVERLAPGLVSIVDRRFVDKATQIIEGWQLQRDRRPSSDLQCFGPVHALGKLFEEVLCLLRRATLALQLLLQSGEHFADERRLRTNRGVVSPRIALDYENLLVVLAGTAPCQVTLDESEHRALAAAPRARNAKRYRIERVIEHCFDRGLCHSGEGE
ncbi:Uncharacterised protein [Mycobacteroides abscessus subsp. abscessus]|nr:Uncharacterised protein [Mycobacteroides abscessus subsp. abscessus]SIL56002.1 Uncharacterised protein [Mycobacteroides abscessus subsp. abscessus]SKU90302.1 Uncharacterised protein [Mycobacteroides abscessus subsp. abscessus]